MIAFLASHTTIPEDGFAYHSSDFLISPYGMAMARSYYTPPPNPPVTPFQGYIFNGEYHQYWNWPPYGFKAYAYWFKLLGNDSIYYARLLSVLLYSINAVLLLLLLLKQDVKLSVAWIATLVFIFLPQHLRYSTLIYADAWLISFWLLMALLYKPYTLKRYGWLLIVALVGARFMHFTLLMLPAPIMIFLVQKYKLSSKHILIGAILLLILILTTEKILFILFGAFSYSIQSLANHSIFNTEVVTNSSLVLRRIASIIVEMIPVIFLVSSKAFLARDEKEHRFNKKLTSLILLFSITVFCFVVALSSWFFVHSHGVPIWSVLISLLVASILSTISSLRKVLTLGIISVMLTLLAYCLLPILLTQNTSLKEVENLVVELAEKYKESATKRPAVFLKLSSDPNQLTLSAFSIKERTRSHVFEQRRNHYSKEKIIQYLNHLAQVQYAYKFDESVFIYVTDEAIIDGYFEVLEEHYLNDHYIYIIAMANIDRR